MRDIHWIGRRHAFAAVTAPLLTLACVSVAFAQSAPAKKHQGKIVCGSFSGDPKKYPAWNDDMTISIERGALIATPARPQGQVMNGTVGASGAVLMAGEGGLPGQPPEWTYEFAGKLNPNGPTVLRGQLANILGGGAKRTCSISF
jgi:hypothetical protein